MKHKLFSKKLNKAIEECAFAEAQNNLEMFAGDEDVLDYVKTIGAYGYAYIEIAFLPDECLSRYSLKDIHSLLKSYNILTPALEQELFCYIFGE